MRFFGSCDKEVDTRKPSNISTPQSNDPPPAFDGRCCLSVPI